MNVIFLYNMQQIEKMERLKLRIDRMNKLQHIEILRILSKNPEVKLNENKSGIFVNLSCLCNDAVVAIEDYIAYIDKQESALLPAETQKEEFKIQYFG